MNTISLPGIKKIEIVRCADLQPNVMLQSICGCVVAIAAPAVAINFSGRPTLEWEGTKVNGKRQEKSTLKFKTKEILPDGEHLAFVVTAASGSQYLIGAHEPNYPMVSYKETTGNPGSDSAIRTYEVKHIAQKSVLPCIL